MIEYRKAIQDEGDDIIDFINYVFSNNSNPHDFKKMCPHIYDSDYPYWNDHYVVVENGHIKATVAIMKENRAFAGIDLKIGHVEQVSVHPYHRGKGYMQKLMRMAIADMQNDGYDYSLLSGQRQRYGYYGYESANYRYNYDISTTNLRHIIGNNDLRVRLEKNNNCYEVFCKDEKIGTINGSHINLTDYSYSADAIEGYFRCSGHSSFEPAIALYDISCARALSDICENVNITNNWTMMKIFNFRRTLTAGLKLRAQAGLCADGEITLKVGNESFGLRVCGSDVQSYDTDTVQYTFEPEQLQKCILLMTGAVSDRRFPFGWFPITL